MKLKRTKLAALALTALMAVGATSLVAYASETEDVASAIDTSTKTETGVVIDFYLSEDDLTNAGVKLTISYSDGTTSTEILEDAATLTTTAAKCLESGSVVAKYSYTLNGTGTTVSNSKTVTIPATGHTANDSTIYKVKTAPTCTTSGIYVYTYTCTVCKSVYDKEVEVAATGHDYDFSGSYTYYALSSDNVTVDTSSTAISANVYADGVDTLVDVSGLQVAKTNSNGSPVITDTSKAATYYMVYTCANGCGVKAAVKITIPASTVSYILIVGQSGLNDQDITDAIANKTKYYSESQLPSNDSIELANCTVDGSITIAYYDSNDVPLEGTKKITITAHHMTKTVAVFSSESDMTMCTVSTDTSGNMVVKNNSCYLTVTYVEQVECTAANCPLTTVCSAKYEKNTSNAITVDFVEGIDTCSNKVVSTDNKTASPAGAHTVLGAAKDDIAELVKDKSTKLTYEDLEDLISTGSYTTSSGVTYAYKDYVKLSDDTSTCTANGTVTVTYICTVDKVNTAATETITVYAKGHDMKHIVTNTVAATCEADGGYDVVYGCVRDNCGYVDTSVETQHYTLARLRHTNELSTDGVHPKNGSDGDSNDYTDTLNQKIYLEITGSKVVDINGYLTKDGTITVADVSSDGSTPVTGNDGWVRIGVSSDDTLAVYARAYTLCTTCTGTPHRVYITPASAGYKSGTNSSTTGTIKVTVDAINKQDSDGAGGYVTLTATYVVNSGITKTVVPATSTFAYYTSESAYTARLQSNTTGTDPDADVKNGLTLDSDGVYRYYLSDVFASSYTGVTSYDGGLFFISNGLVDTSANELCLYGGVWYYVSNGQVQLSYTGLAQHDGAWFYVTSGVLDTTKNGLVTYDGAQFLVAAGQVLTSYNGLWQYSSAIGGDDNWYFIAAGQVVDYSGVVMYDNAFFVVVDGVLDTSYNGTVEYDGATFNVVAGQLYDQVA